MLHFPIQVFLFSWRFACIYYYCLPTALSCVKETLVIVMSTDFVFYWSCAGLIFQTNKFRSKDDTCLTKIQKYIYAIYRSISELTNVALIFEHYLFYLWIFFIICSLNNSLFIKPIKPNTEFYCHALSMHC